MEGAVDIFEERLSDLLILHVRGRLDAKTSADVEKRVFERIREGHHKLLLEFSGVTYLSSAGMRMLLSTSKKLKTLAGKFCIINVNSDVMDLLVIAGFNNFIDICQTEDEALTRLSSSMED